MIVSSSRRFGEHVHTITFADASTIEPATIVWATEYRHDDRWIDIPSATKNGQLVTTAGITSIPGLYTIGRQWQYTRGSSLLGSVGLDAHHVAAHLLGDRGPEGQHRQRQGAHPSLAGHIERAWLPRKQRQLRPATLDGYLRHLRLYILPALGHCPLRSLRVDQHRNPLRPATDLRTA